MSNNLDDATCNKMALFTEQILRGAASPELRTGQYLFNHLPHHIGAKVSGTSFDPFHKNLSAREIYAWLDNHLIFDGYEIIGLFHNNNLLWEKV